MNSRTPPVARSAMNAVIAGLALPLLLAAGQVVAQDSKSGANPPAPAASQATAATAATAKPITVNGKVISKAKMDAVVKQRVAQGQPDNEQTRRGLLDILINQELLAQEADRRGLTKSADAQIQMDLARQSALANMVIEDYIKTHPVKDEIVRAEYDKIRDQRGTREFRARHILVETEAAAKTIIDKLKKGEKFEDLAKDSKDPGTKERGGDLDWASPTNFVKPFSDAMIKLEKGKFTETPVQTQFGWHIIRLDDSRSTQFPPFDQVKAQLANGMQQQEIQRFLAELRSKAKIEAQ